MRFYRSMFSVLAFILFISSSSIAQWSTDPGVNNPICTEYSDQAELQIVSDNAGGAIISWYDWRTENYEIYTQRINGSGNIMWDYQGVFISDAVDYNDDIDFPSLSACPDGQGGVFIAWSKPSGDGGKVFYQHVLAGGTTQWSNPGLLVSASPSYNSFPIIRSDPGGNVYVVFTDDRSGDNSDVYMQKVDPTGQQTWSVNDVSVFTGAGDQFAFDLFIDANNFSYVAGWDERGGSGTYRGIYLQKINNDNSLLEWTPNGIELSTVYKGIYPKILDDTQNGIIVFWRSQQNGIVAQRVDGNGNCLWANGGIQFPNSQELNAIRYPSVVEDGNGGAVVAYDDLNNAYTSSDIILQRINSDGELLWGAEGKNIGTDANIQVYPKIIKCSDGNYIITWIDATNQSFKLVAQKVDSDGETLWTQTGVNVTTAGEENSDQILVPCENGGAVFAWLSKRSNNSGKDIYSAYLNSAGQLGVVTDIGNLCYAIPKEYSLTQNYPNPFNPTTSIRFGLPQDSNVKLVVYNTLGQKVVTLLDERMSVGYHQVVFNASLLNSGVYFYRIEAGSFTRINKMILLK